MKRSTLRPAMAMTWPLAQGHDVKDGKPEVIRPAADNAATWPAGSIFSSALDLSRWVIALLNDGKLDGSSVLPPKLIATMESPHARIPGSDAQYGYGLSLETRRGVPWAEHGGSRAGYGSLIRMAPARKFGVIILANRSGSSMPKLAEAICEQMLSLKQEARKESQTHTLEEAELKRYAGVYVNGASRYKLDVNQGVLQGGNGATRVRFTRAGDGFLLGETRLIVIPDANGGIEFVFAGGRAFHRAQP